MTIVHNAICLMKDLDASRKPGEILAGIRLFTQDFGFSRLAVMRQLPDPEQLRSGLIHIDAPKDFVADFDARKYAKYTPLLNRATHELAPFTVLESLGQRLSEREHEVMDFVHERLDVTDGFVVPVRGESHEPGVFMFGGYKPKCDPLERTVLTMLGHFAYGQIQDLLKAANVVPGEAQFRSPLTARERECLHWVSQGKTDFEIGVILGISARTARFHIENSKRKFGVTSRVQAVTAAMRAHAIAA